MGWVLSFENLIRSADPVDKKGKATRTGATYREFRGRLRVVGDPRHVEKLHAREPGDLCSA